MATEVVVPEWWVPWFLLWHVYVAILLTLYPIVIAWLISKFVRKAVG